MRRRIQSTDNSTGRLIAVFKRLICDGTLVPGCRLPAERELAESFGCARSTLRQALKVLEILGVISQRVGDGTYLNPAADSILAESMEFLILLDGISFQELMEARLLIEPELAFRAAQRATPSDISELTRLYRCMREKKKDRIALLKYDLLFHQAIHKVAGNRVCSHMFATIHQSVLQLVELTAKMVDPDHTLLLHRRILSAIRAKDPERTRQRMTEHLKDATQLIAEVDELIAQDQLLARLKKFAADENGGPNSRPIEPQRIAR